MKKILIIAAVLACPSLTARPSLTLPFTQQIAGGSGPGGGAAADNESRNLSRHSHSSARIITLS